MRGCRPLTPEEFVKVIEAIDGRFKYRDRLIMQFGDRTGLRISEILSVLVKDVFQYGMVPDRVTIQRRNMKGKQKGRVVLLHPELKVAIVNYLVSAPHLTPDSPLFMNQFETKAISRQQAWNVLTAAYEVCELTGKLGTHSLRKSFAKRIYEKSGHCLLKTKAALGQSDVRTTEQYLSFEQEEIDELILSV